VAQKRQRSKQRQAERRAQRLAERGGDGARSNRAEAERQRDPDYQELEENVDLEVGAPPEEVGRSDFTTRHEEPPPPDFEIDDEELADEADEAAPPGGPRGPRGVRGEGGAAGPGEPLPRERGRLVEFLKAVWAELQRVQWPNRKAVTQLTGVVLFFVLLVGAYLGGLDAVFAKLIQTIL
jgi:preprotein translocase subunit SecE